MEMDCTSSWILQIVLFLTSLSKPVYAYVLQIIVAANHMSGKDTHVRGLRVLGPIESVLGCFSHLNRPVDTLIVQRYHWR